MTTRESDDYDSPWKEVLDTYFPQFLAFFFPDIYADIDWSRDYEVLDTALQQITRDADQPRRAADKLVKVWRRSGQETWVIVHSEIQTWDETGFERRVFIYFYRLSDRYPYPIVSLAVLGDDRPNWRPDTYTTELWGCGVQFHFPVVKLLDYADRWAELEASDNPFATVVMAHLKTQATRHDPLERKAWKTAITRRMYERGYTEQEILDLFRFIDWLMHLPDDLKQQFWQEHIAYEREGKMPYVMTVERYAREEALEEGEAIGLEKGEAIGLEKGERKELLAGLEIILDLKFGEAGLALLPEIQQLPDIPLLRAVREHLRTATSLDTVREMYHEHLPPPAPEEGAPEADAPPPEPSQDAPANGTA